MDLLVPLDRAQRVVASGDDHGRAAHDPQPIPLVDPAGLEGKLRIQGGVPDLVGHAQGRLHQVGTVVDDVGRQQHRQ